jgi:hypothetical protein
MAESLTTIVVPERLGERLGALAEQQRSTAAEVIAALLDDADRRARFDAVRTAYAADDASYAAESETWDAWAGDGLPP